jgi:hypothetical protein
VSPDGFDTAVEILVEEGFVEQRDDELQPAPDAERILHSGEV